MSEEPAEYLVRHAMHHAMSEAEKTAKRHRDLARIYRAEAQTIEAQWQRTKRKPTWSEEEAGRRWIQSPEAQKARRRLEWADKYEGYAKKAST